MLFVFASCVSIYGLENYQEKTLKTHNSKCKAKYYKCSFFFPPDLNYEAPIQVIKNKCKLGNEFVQFLFISANMEMKIIIEMHKVHTHVQYYMK